MMNIAVGHKDFFSVAKFFFFYLQIDIITVDIRLFFLPSWPHHIILQMNTGEYVLFPMYK